jgi:hypothetical protein
MVAPSCFYSSVVGSCIRSKGIQTFSFCAFRDKPPFCELACNTFENKSLSRMAARSIGNSSGIPLWASSWLPFVGAPGGEDLPAIGTVQQDSPPAHYFDSDSPASGKLASFALASSWGCMAGVVCSFLTIGAGWDLLNVPFIRSNQDCFFALGWVCSMG